MKALVWHGKEDIRCDTVTDPELQDPRDAIMKVTRRAAEEEVVAAPPVALLRRVARAVPQAPVPWALDRSAAMARRKDLRTPQG